MNNFPAMTEEQRQELIQHATEEIRLKTEHIARLEKHMPGQFNTSRYQMDVLTAKIALAALTAEPVAYTYAEELETLRKGSFAGMFTPHEAYKADPLWMPLFTAPPAPVLKPIELPEALLPANHKSGEAFMAADSQGNYINREFTIKAIRAAGYEVKQ